MKPKDKQYLVTETSKRMGIDEVRTEAIISYYWRHIRDFMQNPSEPTIFLNKLGSFTLNLHFVERYIEDKIIYIERMGRRLEKGEELSHGQQEYYIRCWEDLRWLKQRRGEIIRERLTKRDKKRHRDEYIKSRGGYQELKEPVEEQKTFVPGLLEAILQKYQDREDSPGETEDMQE